MIKRTLYFGNPAYLKTANGQLLISLKGEDEPKSVPIEDIGIMLLDHPQITVTQVLMERLLANNVALITCNETHHPVGLMLNLDGHTLQSQRFQYQVDATIPLKKQLWQQTIECKLRNQAKVLEAQRIDGKYIFKLSQNVKSGDADNNEAQAAAYYWSRLFPDFLDFKRDRFGDPPNNLLNYGYSLVRALVARCLIGSGLLPTLGIFHRNQYNAYCLADDIMEPYRPYVDLLVCQIIRSNGKFLDMTPTMKKELLAIPAMDVVIDGLKSPLMNAVQRTTASLAKCFEGNSRKILYPQM